YRRGQRCTPASGAPSLQPARCPIEPVITGSMFHRAGWLRALRGAAGAQRARATVREALRGAARTGRGTSHGPFGRKKGGAAGLGGRGGRLVMGSLLGEAGEDQLA